MFIDTQPITLWDGPAPGSETWDFPEQAMDGGGIRNITTPTLTPYLPTTATDRAIIILPGGALHFLAYAHEGTQVGEFLRDAGIAAFLLKYRVVPTPADTAGFDTAMRDAFVNGLEPIMREYGPLAVADAERAVAMVRAAGYRHITMVGFSAGARVAADVVLNSAPEQRPDAAGIVYVYHPDVSALPVSADAPPIFIAASIDDPIGIDGSIGMFTTWRAAGRPVELHLYERGSHGWGMAPVQHPVRLWTSAFLAWHASQGT